ncbi:MAG: TlpA disulfide reductase family protein [Candidatus Limnocylindrales bacterium]
MRGPIFAGALGGLLVILIAVATFVAISLGAPDRVLPTPGATPTEPSLLAASPSPIPTPTPTLSRSPSPSLATDGSSPSPDPTPTASPSVAVGLNVGDRAPGLQLFQLGGGEIDTSALAGQPLWINFMASWCPPCRDELPQMALLQAQLGESMTIIVVDVGEDEATVSAFMDSLEVDLPTGLDVDSAAQRTWGAYALPVHYWVDANGRIGGFLYGGSDREQFIDGIHTVLPDIDLTP